ncbi:MAG: GerMN domain-containing protein [Spirochaetales bacterium]|nr:GerMN domain-containing protein [Spirochaetales bacterium]
MAKRKASIGCLFWLALVLLVIVIVLANLKTANEIIKKTGFQDVISELMKKKEKPEKDENENRPQEDDHNEQPSGNQDHTGRNDNKDDIQVTEDEGDDTPVKSESTPVPARTEENKQKRLRRALIYFVRVNEEGAIQLKSFERTVYYKDSPLTDTLLTLLQGPNSREINMECYSMIPENTRLNNVYVKGDVAFVDFNENFRFNPLGMEGLKAQLNQVVYTVTEFSNVKRIQILIDGKKVNYLGPEGIFIGEPLSRSSLIAIE